VYMATGKYLITSVIYCTFLATVCKNLDISSLSGLNFLLGIYSLRLLISQRLTSFIWKMCRSSPILIRNFVSYRERGFEILQELLYQTKKK
jgi:hypothetical protein